MLDQQFYPSSRDAVTEEVHTGPAELAFLAVENKTILRKPLHKSANEGDGTACHSLQPGYYLNK
jgi:hypothetical protein